MSNVRTRFAPSPTGYLHVGAVRTALFAWLVARQHQGEFVLRIEDTDKKREVTEAEQHIIKTLNALRIFYDEGPDVNGPHGPYRQSDRLDIYHKWAQKLIDKGRAYADPYTPEQLSELREEARRSKRPFLFRDHRPVEPPKWDGSTPLRFKSDPKAYQWNDAVMGALSTGPEVVDDFILMKSDGYPTYNFAHIVDDAEMNITHVIRGQEFMASMPNYLNLYEALSLETPLFATMPPILGPDGKKKLSKRDDAKDVLNYLKNGYLPDALISFIATLGWNDGTEKEVFTREELIETFSLSRVGKSGAKFDERRLLWANGSFIRAMETDTLYNLAYAYFPEEAQEKSPAFNKHVLAAIQERLKFFSEIPELTLFFYRDLPVDAELIQNHKKLKHYSNDELISLLESTLQAFESIEFSQETIHERLQSLLLELNEKPVTLFSLIRIATTQSAASPALVDTLNILGKNRVLSRIEQQIKALR